MYTKLRAVVMPVLAKNAVMPPKIAPSDKPGTPNTLLVRRRLSSVVK